MRFHILDTRSIMTRLLTAGDDRQRKGVFESELVAPFAGLAEAMGGGDAVAMFRHWGIRVDHFAGGAGSRVGAALETLEAADAWHRAAAALEKGWSAFRPYHSLFDDGEITFGLLLCDLSAVPHERGYSGFGAVPGWIMTVYDEPSEYNLQRIEAATVHELHHNLLRRISPVDMTSWTVGDYMVMEGLAESFAAELYGEDRIGFWVTDFDMSRFEEARARLAPALEKTGFGLLRSYIFGDGFAGYAGIEDVGVPTFAGYALGYHLVQEWRRRTGKSTVDATVLPWRQIIEESGFFA